VVCGGSFSSVLTARPAYFLIVERSGDDKGAVVTAVT